MKTKSKNIKECAALFEIEFSKEALAKAFEEVYDEISKAANIPGFRPGKAPRDLVKKHYADAAKEEVLKRLVPEAYRRALEDNKLAPIGAPEISDINFEDEKPLSFKIKIETRPKFKLKDYKGLTLEKNIHKVTEEETDKTIQNLREMNAKYVPVEDRPAQFGDYLVSDLDCFVDGKPIHKTRENLWIYLDKEALIPELNEKMVGMKKLEERDIEVKLPEKYPDKKMVGKLAVYHVKVKEIKARVLPSLDDEFAKDLGKEKFDDLKKTVSEELGARARMNAEIETENQLLGKLMDSNLFAVPESLVARQLNMMVEDAKRRLASKGFQREELDKKNEDFIKKFKEDAVRHVRLLFILDAIASEEKIGVAAEDIEKAYKMIAAQSGKSVEEIKGHYEKEGLVDSLESKVREEKTIRLLLEKAKIEEKEK